VWSSSDYEQSVVCSTCTAVEPFTQGPHGFVAVDPLYVQHRYDCLPGGALCQQSSPDWLVGQKHGRDQANQAAFSGQLLNLAQLAGWTLLCCAFHAGQLFRMV
jgi:hypothetical protein